MPALPFIPSASQLLGSDQFGRAVDGAVPDLDRKELLGAIDHEITQRETAMSRHGINLWAVVGGAVALGWANLLEATERIHDWTNVLLICFVAWWLLSQLSFLLLRTMTWSDPLQRFPHPNRTVRGFVLSSGMHPERLGYYLAESAVGCAFCVYFLHRGFTWLWWSGVLYFGIGFFSLLFVLGVLQVKLPIPMEATGSRGLRLWGPKGVLWGLVSVYMAASFLTLGQRWPAVSKFDVRLGFLSAGLLAIVGFYAKSALPPVGLRELRSLRACLAFGLTPPSAALKDARDILLGPPRVNYVSDKARGVIDLLQRRNQCCLMIGQRMDDLVTLAKRVDASPTDQALLREARDELNMVYRDLNRGLRRVDRLLVDAVELQVEVRKRMRIARVMLGVPQSELDAISEQMKTASSASNAARKSIVAKLDVFEVEANKLGEAVRSGGVGSENARVVETLSMLFKG